MAPSVKAAKAALKNESLSSVLKIVDTPKVATKVAASEEPIRGIPKSGRVWKDAETARSSAKVARCKSLKKTWEEKTQERQKNKLLKQQVKDLQEATKLKKQQERERKEEKKRIKEENERKSQIVQTITDTRKLKRMSRKQLKTLIKA